MKYSRTRELLLFDPFDVEGPSSLGRTAHRQVMIFSALPVSGGQLQRGQRQSPSGMVSNGGFKQNVW